MNYVKVLSLIAVMTIASILSLGDSPASATVLCKTNLSSGCAAAGWDYSGPLTASLKPGTSLWTENTSGAIEETCSESSISGTASTGSPSETASSIISKEHLTWGRCSNTVTTTAGGTLEVHNISGTSNGTLTAKEFKVTSVVAGVSCSYGAQTGIDLGTLTEGNPATIDINAVVNKVEGSFLCPSDTIWRGTYVVTTPSGTLGVAAS